MADIFILNTDGKRNIQSMKNTIKGRKKREIGDSALPDSRLYQTYPSDYDEFADEYPLEKRFLGKFSIFLKLFIFECQFQP